MQGCGTCRIRKKKCPGPSAGHSGGCTKCRELGIECLKRYREPVPQKYRTAAVTKALARWYRSRGSRQAGDFLSLSDIVDPVKIESPSLSDLLLSSASPPPTISSPAIAHSTHSSPPSSSPPSPFHDEPVFEHPVLFQPSFSPVIPFHNVAPNYISWTDNAYPLQSQLSSYQYAGEPWQGYVPTEPNWVVSNVSSMNLSSARFSPFSLASSAPSPSISDGPSFGSGPRYDPPYDVTKRSFYGFGQPF